MTRSANGFLLYLDRYLDAHPGSRRKLRAFFQQSTGRALNEGHLWKHANRKVEPSLSAALVYMIFLSRAGELKALRKPGALFAYKHPEWLRATVPKK